MAKLLDDRGWDRPVVELLKMPWGISGSYEFLTNSIQRELYCPCFYAVPYLIPTQLVSSSHREMLP